MEDEDLLRRARHGDRNAFSELVTAYQDRLYTTALRVVGNSADAADVVQETFLRAYLHLDDLDARGLRAWLFRVAVNCCRDLQRRQQRRPWEPIGDAQGNVVELPAPELGPEERAILRERRETVAASLARLPLDLRTVVVLRDVNQLSYEEIATVLRIPVGTAKSRVNRARLQLAAGLRGSPLFAAEGGAS